MIAEIAADSTDEGGVMIKAMKDFQIPMRVEVDKETLPLHSGDSPPRRLNGALAPRSVMPCAGCCCRR